MAAGEVAGVAGIYISGSSLGGFCGRFIPGVVADLAGWRAAFLRSPRCRSPPR